MNDLLRREEVLTTFDTALESGAFRGRYDTYEKITDAIRKDIPSVGQEKCSDCIFRNRYRI